MTTRRSLPAVCLAALIFADSARAWDAPGHEAVDAIAYAHLNPKARDEVDRLAALLPHSRRPYNGITVGCWMDDIRSDASVPSYGLFKSWHYIDIPIDSRDPMPSFEPGADNEKKGDAVQGFKRALVVLEGGTDPFVKDAPMALAIVEHLAGDLHQPLHCATKYFYSHGTLRDDKGGNDEFVVNGPANDPKFNLHAFWDRAYRATFDSVSGVVEIDPDANAGGAALAAELRDERVDPSLVTTDVDAWARESNAIARDFVYRDLTAADSPKFCRIGNAYAVKARATARSQIERAGLRLARVLNETLGAATPPPVPPSFPAGPPE